MTSFDWRVEAAAVAWIENPISSQAARMHVALQAAGVPALLAENEKLRDALEWIYAEPEDPHKVQARARAVLSAHTEGEREE